MYVGPDPEDYQPLIDWGIFTEPIPGANGRRFHYAQGKALGVCDLQIYDSGRKANRSPTCRVVRRGIKRFTTEQPKVGMNLSPTLLETLPTCGTTCSPS